MKRLFILTCVFVLFAFPVHASEFTILHDFLGGENDGKIAQGDVQGDLVVSGDTLYGMTVSGGTSDWGTIFAVGTGGTGFTLLHKFLSGGDDGKEPTGSLTLSGSKLYGMTSGGGLVGGGTLFSIDMDGSDFTLLREFKNGLNDGEVPYGDLALSGDILYGMTYGGGVNTYGTIFSIDTNGSGYTRLYDFVGPTGDGMKPYGGLTVSGDTLYGMTYGGGSVNLGTVFSIGKSGSDYTILHIFSAANGGRPHGDLTLVNGVL
ncbi:choice-of-anchor tandem repeat GloVer-containing protein [Candidatus Auribacterota bacterium]